MKALIRNALGALCATLFLALAQTAAAEAATYPPENATESSSSVNDDWAQTKRRFVRPGCRHAPCFVVRVR